MTHLLRLLGHLWALPNTLVGLVFGIGGNYRADRTNRVIVVQGGWMVQVFSRLGYAGMCVGDVVLCRGELWRYSPAVYRHELVHAFQSQLLGPLYLPVTVLGYLFGLLIFPQDPHDASPLEVWADIASGNADRNRYLTHLRHRRGNGNSA